MLKMASPKPNNAVLVGPEDENWQYAVLNFLANNPSAVLTTAERDALGNLVEEYWRTSGNFDMQLLLMRLDGAYDLAGRSILEWGTLIGIYTANANAMAMMAQEQEPLLPQPTHPLQPTTSPDTTIIMGTMAPEIAPASTLPPPHSRLAIDRRNRNWVYVCDVCGHKISDRNEAAEHIRVGAQRRGFKITGADPASDPHWYGVDVTSREYTGDIVSRTSLGGGNLKSGRVPPPCGPNLTAAKAAKKQKQKRRREETSEEKGDGEE